MSDIRNKFRESITPAIESRRSFTTTGVVKATYPKTMTCQVTYIENTGKRVTDTAKIKMHMPGFIGWFPQANERVVIDVSDSIITITGPVIASSYDANNYYALKNEKLNSNFGGTMSGMIF